MQASGPNGGQSSDGPADPAADEARNYLARTVAQCGDDIEQIILVRNPDDPTLWFLNDKQSAAYQQYRQLVEKFRMEMKTTDRNEDMPNSEVICERGSNVQQEQSEYGPPSFQPENTPSAQREQPDDTNVMKQEDMESDKQDQENDSSHQSKVSSKRSGDESDEGQASGPRRRKRRSRWAPETEKFAAVPGSTVTETGGGSASMTVSHQPPGTNTSAAGAATSGSGHLLTKVMRTDPALIQYAVQAFGTSNLSEDDWKKAEDHYKINLLYQDMLRKRQELERLQRAGKFKYEYDSDEETDGGTWEHRLRLQEMEATQRWAEELTKKAEGKHHIGDFLPPDELERFLEKYNALKEGREPDLSDYKEYKLKEDNIGFQMLQKLGWTEGQGLGSEGHGIVEPVNKASSRPENQGLGVERPEDVTHGDDEYDAYRKRMMLAYRFRPNPLNNPRRPYY
jgi:splicing factor 4